MARVIGIDLGTTNSVVAVLENNRPEVLQNAEGHKTTPSVIHFPESEEEPVLVGELAKRQLLAEPRRTINSVKRFMGCRWGEVEDRQDGVAYKISAGEDGMVAVEIGEKRLRPAEVSAETLKKMRETAEAYLGEEVHDAVITVPAHFNDSQRQATKAAAELAGLNCLRMVNEPTAAALAYGLNRRERERIAIFDFGGGTFDISILEIDGEIFEVKSTDGDTYLGGDNIDQALTAWIRERVEKDTGIDPATDAGAMQRIAETAEKVKCELSSLSKTLIALPFIVSDDSGPRHFSAEITREEFTALIAAQLLKLKPPCERALHEAGIQAKDLTGVILVGGSTRIPAVRELVRQIFGREPDTSINPDEVVACGAAIQAGILSGDLAELLLLDVTPLSLGIELAGDVFSPIISRNSNVPTTVGKKFTTVRDNQSTVRVHVLQGERKQASLNRSLGHYKLNGIAPAPKEIPEVNVRFHIDANGMLTVSAEDLTSGASMEVEVESYAPIDEGSSERIAADAAEHADEDRIFMQKALVRRRLEEMESVLKAARDREGPGYVHEETQIRLKETFFKLEVALGQDDWALVEEAERNAKSVFLEITSILALKRAPKEGDGQAIEFTMDAPTIEPSPGRTGTTG